jgi:myosin heavy subunit
MRSSRRRNSLEQLFINFANERIQLFFLSTVFYAEEQVIIRLLY